MKDDAFHGSFLEILRGIPRRYRLPALPSLGVVSKESHRHANRLAVLIEHTRLSLVAGREPGEELRLAFLNTLQALIADAIRPEAGDTTFQALTLKHRSKWVQEYVSLASQRAQDMRRVHTLVNAVAHPAKLERLPQDALRQVLGELQTAATSERWSETSSILHRILDQESASDIRIHESLEKLRQESGLARLLRLEALLEREDVRQYRALWEQQGPPANSHAAVQEGAQARRRGMDVESQTKYALEAVAEVLNRRAGTQARYRVATSMYVPASLAGHHEGGKTEWDAVLLRQAGGEATSSAEWDVLLLLEAKASADAIATDFPRLLRGLRLLTQAESHTSYAFRAREGSFLLRGASLNVLPTEPDALEGTVLYTSDAMPEDNPRLLSAGGRMQLLTAAESLAYATALADGMEADAEVLAPLWEQLLTSSSWQGVLQQYPLLRHARELMVHVDDLAAAAG